MSLSPLDGRVRLRVDFVVQLKAGVGSLVRVAGGRGVALCFYICSGSRWLGEFWGAFV